MTVSLIVFWLLAIVSVGAALTMIGSRNPVRSALALVVTFLCVAVYYITLSAQFLAAVQVFVYAGAIMVLFLFVIMLLNLGAPNALKESGSVQSFVAFILGAIFIGGLFGTQALAQLPVAAVPVSTTTQMGTVENVGLSLYSPSLPWLFPFEITSLLLLVAVIGAIVLSKRRL